MTQAEKILSKLEARGDKGVYNTELNNICFRYGARLHELRKDGYMISTIHISESLFKFVLHKPELVGTKYESA